MASSAPASLPQVTITSTPASSALGEAPTPQRRLRPEDMAVHITVRTMFLDGWCW